MVVWKPHLKNHKTLYTKLILGLYKDMMMLSIKTQYFIISFYIAIFFIVSFLSSQIQFLSSQAVSAPPTLPTPSNPKPDGVLCMICELLLTTNDSSSTNIFTELNNFPGGINGLNFSYSNPSNGFLTLDHSNLIYTPKEGFIGNDSFILQGKNKSNPQDVDSILVEVSVESPNLQIFTNPIFTVIVSFFAAFVVVLTIWCIATAMIRRFNNYSITKDNFRYSLWDIIRGPDMLPSLSSFQFLLWTLVILFAIIGVYLVRILQGVSDPPSGPIPVNILALMGISVGVPIINSLTHRYRSIDLHHIEKSDTEQRNSENKLKLRKLKGNGLGHMLYEDEKPSLNRFQMFSWTVISIGIYLIVLFSKVIESANNPNNLILPDIDPIFVVLMGLSQIAFLGIKSADDRLLKIVKIIPNKVRAGDYVSIFGNNFGENGGIVWIDKRRMRFPGPDNELSEDWSDDRIDIRIPTDMENGIYDIIVAKAGHSVVSKEKLEVINEFKSTERHSTNQQQNKNTSLPTPT
jgi:hypothetical protein